MVWPKTCHFNAVMDVGAPEGVATVPSAECADYTNSATTKMVYQDVVLTDDAICLTNDCYDGACYPQSFAFTMVMPWVRLYIVAFTRASESNAH